MCLRTERPDKGLRNLLDFSGSLNEAAKKNKTKDTLSGLLNSAARIIKTKIHYPVRSTQQPELSKPNTYHQVLLTQRQEISKEAEPGALYKTIVSIPAR